MSTMPTRAQLKRNLKALSMRLERKPMDLDARMRVARSYRLLGDKKSAVAHYRTVARYLSLSAQPLQAIAVLKELLQVDPKHEETLLFLAKLYARTHTGDGGRGRVATPVLDPHKGGPLALPEGLPASGTGIWRAVRARSTDVHGAIEGNEAPHDDDVSIANELRELEETFELDEADVLEETALDVGGPSASGPSTAAPGPGAADVALVPDADGYEVLGALTTEDVLLPQVPLFSSLSPAAFVEFGHAMVFHRAPQGRVIFAEGDPGDSCIVVSRGRMRALRRGDGDVDVELMKLSEGDIAGVFALMASERRQATLVAETDCEYFEIDRLAVTALVDKYPSVERELHRFFRERLLLNVLAVLPHFSSLSPSARQDLAARFVDRTYEEDDELFYEGGHRAGLWILTDGAVKLVSERQGVVVRLVSGDFVGTFAGVVDDVTEVSAVASRRTTACLLPHKDVEELLAGLPDVDAVKARFEAAEMMISGGVFAGNARLAGNLARLDRAARSA